ncbi:thiamine phosphate synthase [Sphingomonas sp.]|uniref:thiamine phosphate synthase n=1 Tax=Sphingomonas sp. TaxID=28214 RepID=UPI0025E381E1|nr:thiamine phosphate synthase [Sphingomonas sp.]
MATNQPSWPRRWLMTDERLGERLWEAVDRLPAGGGIVFRHYSLSESERLEIGRELGRRAVDRGLVLGVAGSRSLASDLDAALVHNPSEPGSLPASTAVHDEAQAAAARKMGAALAFIGPIFPTRSHPGRPALGQERARELALLVGCPAIALGGMDENRFAALHQRGFHGFAGIDCWLRT